MVTRQDALPVIDLGYFTDPHDIESFAHFHLRRIGFDVPEERIIR